MKLFLPLFYSFFTFIINLNLNASESLLITNAKIRIVPPAAPATALYMEIKNQSKKEVKIIAITSKEFKKIELHEMKHENNMMTMRKLDFITIKPETLLELKRGSYHGMIFDLNSPLQKDKKYQFQIIDSEKNQYSFTAIATEFN